YNALVVGPQSVLKRLFPQGNPQEFKEIPGQANFSASAIGLNQESLPVNIKAGDGSTPPTLNFPHLGSLYEYFLVSLQKALRPFSGLIPPASPPNLSTPNERSAPQIQSQPQPPSSAPTPPASTGSSCADFPDGVKIDLNNGQCGLCIGGKVSSVVSCGNTVDLCANQPNGTITAPNSQKLCCQNKTTISSGPCP
ncbi:MAG: hypothetical protein AAB768_00215, partial [Patescibacteria group bacterium]